jgi:hypothetical protein
MKKFIITEEEKNRILGMHQDHGYNSLNEQNITEATAGGKFPCINYFSEDGDTVGYYAPAKMDFVRLFYKNSIIIVWVNKTLKQYERNGNAAGSEIRKGTWKCKADNSNVDFIWDDDKPAKPPKPALKPSGTSTPNTTGSSIGVIYKYEYPNDNKYRYGVKDKKWFGKNLANGKEFDLSTITTTIANLNNTFPNAMEEEPLQAAKPVTPNPETATAGVVQEPVTTA